MWVMVQSQLQLCHLFLWLKFTKNEGNLFHQLGDQRLLFPLTKSFGYTVVTATCFGLAWIPCCCACVVYFFQKQNRRKPDAICCKKSLVRTLLQLYWWEPSSDQVSLYLRPRRLGRAMTVARRAPGYGWEPLRGFHVRPALLTLQDPRP